ncbi:transposase [Clostridium cochlearium]|uniref:transposase n=1 Tax=Clostridium cochlearium TaxID=1494 RepID=UPI00241C33C7|nr:transposase [Clostridium cochlearium]MBE6065446.1 transposase [Clostridium cochlearium]
MHKKREWFPNSEYHITSRGNRRNDIFRDEEDFQVYITIIENSLEHFKGQFELICYCLMDNHVHLLLKSKDRHIKFLMSRINSIYAKYFNEKYNYCGHLYEKRYFSELIEKDSQLLETSRYIHLNPVKANMVENPEDYKWSSYKMYIGQEKEKLIKSDEVLNYFKEENKRELYKEFIEEYIKIKMLKEVK